MISRTINDNYIITVIIATSVVFFVAYKIFKKKLTSTRYHPGPKGFPFIGTVTPVTHKSLWHHLDSYGDVSSFDVFGTKIVVLNTVETVVDAFHSTEYSRFFNGRPEMFFGRYIVYEDVVFRSSHEPNWMNQRSVLSSYLKAHGDQGKVTEKVISDELSVVNDFLTQKSRDNEEFDFDECLSPSLANIILILLIGKRFDYTHDVMKAMCNATKTGSYLVGPVVNFLLTNIPILRHLPFGMGSVYRATKRHYDQLIKIVLDDAREMLRQNRDCEGVIFDLLNRQKQSSWITDDILKGVIQDINGAAITSTTFLLYGFFLVLINNHHIQTAIQREIDDIIGQDRVPNTTDRKLMPYMEAVLLEITRYCNITPLGIPHMCTRDVEFRGFTVPKGTLLLPNFWRIHYDQIWGNPWEFDPTRFLDEHGQLLPASHPIRKRFLPFGIGKRHCPGEMFAKNRMFLYITNILQRFTLLPGDVLPSCDPRGFSVDFTMHAAPYKLRIQHRDL